MKPNEQQDINEVAEERTADNSGKTSRPWWVKVLKWAGISVGVLAALFILICTLIVWILTPARLTPLVEEQASKYLDADVKASRIELTFWHTFPKMTVDVDSLRLMSRSLDKLPDSVKSRLPEDYRHLLELRSFHGGVNVLAMLKGDISLYDVTFRGMEANLVQVNDSVSNYDIFPTSEEADTSSVSVPSISINRFEIVDAAPLRYRSLADSTDITVALRNVTLRGHDAPQYRLEIEGNLKSPILEQFRFAELSLGAQGTINWDREKPMAIGINDFLMKLDDYAVTINTNVDFSDTPEISELRAEFDKIPLQSVLEHAPASLQYMLSPLRTSMLVTSNIQLTRPWNLADSAMPSFDATVEIPPCEITYDGYRFDDVQAMVEARFDGSDINASTFTLKGMHISGESLNFDLDLSVTNIKADPLIDGAFKGRINLSRLPGRLKALIPLDISGQIDGRSIFRFYMSDLSREGFHRLHADGEINLTDLRASDPGLLNAYSRHARLQFGTNQGFVKDGAKIDSLLQVSLEIDTLAANGMGMNLEIRSLKAGVGSVNRASSADTSEINPFGGRLSIAKLKFDAPDDTMRARLRDASIGMSLRRFKGAGRSPLLTLGINARRLMFGQALTKVSLREAEADMTIHLNEARAARRQAAKALTEEQRAQRAARRKARLDSLSHLPEEENVDFDLSRKQRNLLRQWDWNGHIRASRGRLVTPYLPLDNRVYNFNMRFNQDSLSLRDVALRCGQSDFTVSGTLSNLRRALTSRRDNTLKMDLRLKCDTVNINELVDALFAGSALASSADSTMVWDDNDSADATRLTAMADTVATGPLLLPHNIDAHLRVRADHILYADMVLHTFRGDLLLYDGALNLRNLSASTEIGSIGLNGLYAGARPDSLQFGMGMKVNNFRLDRLTSLVPAIDTIMPMMQNFSGVVNADIAVTTDILRNMDIDIPSLKAAIKIEGDSLVLMDPATFKTVSKWLLFRNKNRNMIDHMEVEAVIENSSIEVYPFMFDIDRYRLGVMGHNDLAMNMNYHVSVLKSPIPFKFGINLKGNPDKLKVRLGGAKVKPGMVGERQQIADNTRINLVQQIDNVFRRGISKARLGRLNFSDNNRRRDAARSAARALGTDMDDDRLTAADSLQMIRAGLIDNPDTTRFPLRATPPAKAAVPKKK